MGYSRQEYWSELPEDLLDPRTKPASPALAGGFFTTGASCEDNLSRPGINLKKKCMKIKEQGLASSVQ